MDMSPAYIKGAAEHFSQARIVFDKFHVMLLAGQALETVRQQLQLDLESRSYGVFSKAA
jgi:transposase